MGEEIWLDVRQPGCGGVTVPVPISTLKKAIASSASNSDPSPRAKYKPLGSCNTVAARFPLSSTWEYPNRDQYGLLFNHAMCSHRY